MSTSVDDRADRIAGHATAFGVGLIVFMLTWTIGAAVTGRILGGQASAYLTMALAVVGGFVGTLKAAQRLTRERRAIQAPTHEATAGTNPIANERVVS